jgi:hypothetical protein
MSERPWKPWIISGLISSVTATPFPADVRATQAMLGGVPSAWVETPESALVEVVDLDLAARDDIEVRVGQDLAIAQGSSVPGSPERATTS